MSDEIDFVEYLRLWALPNSNNQAVQDLHRAADEIERLRSLISELLPYMLNDMEQGLQLGPAEDHIEDTQCPDCQWFEDATLWKNRVNGGEFKDYNI